MHASAPPSCTSDPAPTWSETARTLVSFLVFLHFFALAVGFASNTWSPSPLLVRLRDVPPVRPYLQLLGWDVPWLGLYSLTHAAEDDTDHTLAAELRMADGSSRQVVLPEPDVRLPERKRRFTRLAATVGELAGNSTVESILPQAIAAHFVGQYGAAGGTIRCRRHFLQPTEAVLRSGRDEIAPYSREQTLYEARILVSDGLVELLKIESAADVAPPAAATPATP
jgi:hypothetical protein